MKITVQPISQPGAGQVLLPLLFGDVDPGASAKIVALASQIQAAASDGKITFTEELFIGLALGALFSK